MRHQIDKTLKDTIVASLKALMVLIRQVKNDIFFNWNSLSFSQECLAWFVTRAQFTNFYRETLFIASIASEFQLMALSLSSEPMVNHRELCLNSMFSNTFGRTHPLLKCRKLGVTMDRSNYTKNVSLGLWQRCRQKC